jgi:hypothetical protein
VTPSLLRFRHFVVNVVTAAEDQRFNTQQRMSGSVSHEPIMKQGKEQFPKVPVKAAAADLYERPCKLSVSIFGQPTEASPQVVLLL